jgi:hypothetical protein
MLADTNARARNSPVLKQPCGVLAKQYQDIQANLCGAAEI